MVWEGMRKYAAPLKFLHVGGARFSSARWHCELVAPRYKVRVVSGFPPSVGGPDTGAVVDKRRAQTQPEFGPKLARSRPDRRTDPGRCGGDVGPGLAQIRGRGFCHHHPVRQGTLMRNSTVRMGVLIVVGIVPASFFVCHVAPLAGPKACPAFLLGRVARVRWCSLQCL